jgi:hypothetical protein
MVVGQMLGQGRLANAARPSEQGYRRQGAL